MKFILGDAVVSCYVDAASLLMMLLLILSVYIHRNETKTLRIFYLLCWTIAVTCVACFVFNAMGGHTEQWTHTVAWISRTLWENCVLVTVILWIAYVECRLYRKWTIARIIRDAPLFIFPVLLIINLFTGIVFSISDENQLQRKTLYYIMLATELLLFLSTSAAGWLFDRRSEKIRFLHVSPVILSMFLSILPQFFTPFNTGIMGFAIGATLMCFSMADENRFLDAESGLYHKGFLTYLLDVVLAGKNHVNSALILEIDGNLPAGFDIIRAVLHRDRDVIRIEEKKCVMFSGSKSRSVLQLLSTHVEEAVQKHNTDHPEEKVRITVRSRVRKENEDSFTFLRSITEDQDEGDVVRGVVSMISELDRLDDELKLAADIQANMMPANFPPFPERTEFELYASMTPAREVGGDFYDFFLVDRDHLAMVIADVSGKGIPAALFMMVSRTLIKNQLMGGCDPATAMERVNLQLCERNSASMFVTVWLAVLEISTGKVLACNAGHENPGIRRSGGDFELLKYKHGMLAGVSKKAKYQNRELELHPGDCVFVYTDGVPETNNTSEDLFGEERLTAVLNRDPDAPPDALIHRMQEAIGQFADGANQFDDITMLCMKYHGTDQTEEPKHDSRQN